jgi:hypothetical protein
MSMKHGVIILAGWFFILSQYPGNNGPITKTIIGGFASNKECVSATKHFSGPPVCHHWWVAKDPKDADGLCRGMVYPIGQKGYWPDPYTEASQCYPGTLQNAQ